MERVTLRVPKQQVEEVEAMVERGEYPNRSEAIRAGIRMLVDDRGESRRRRVKTDGGEPDEVHPIKQPPWFRDYRGGDVER